MNAVAIFGWILVLAGLAAGGFGVYAILRGGRDGEPGEGGLGPISERGIHILAGARIILVGVLCILAGLYAILRIA